MNFKSLLYVIASSFSLITLTACISENSAENEWSPENDKNLLEWDENRPLKWSDFKGEVESESSFAAVSYTEIWYTYEWYEIYGSVQVETEVHSYFNHQKSWCSLADTSVELLIHEQGHFDINEIHARELRKAFAEFDFSYDVEEEIELIFESIMEERQLMQDQYDRETDHYFNVEKQLEWNRFIEKRLAELNDFSE